MKRTEERAKVVIVGIFIFWNVVWKFRKRDIGIGQERKIETRDCQLYRSFDVMECIMLLLCQDMLIMFTDSLK